MSDRRKADLDEMITPEQWAEIAKARGKVSEDASGKPHVLIRYQAKLLETVAANAVTVYEKGRRTGVTWAAAALAVVTSAAEKRAGGMDSFYIGYNLDMAREFIDTAADWAKRFHGALSSVQEFIFDDGDPDRQIKAFRISFPSGFEIVALSSRPRSLRGRQGFVIIDEAAFHDDFKGLLDAALALLMWGGKILVISTHFGRDNAFNVLVEDIRSGRKPYALLRTDFDDALRDGLYERVCHVQGKEWTPEGEADYRAAIRANYSDAADEELYCIPSQGSGVFLPGPLIESRMHDAPILRLSLPASFFSLPERQKEAEIEAWIEDQLNPVMEATLDKNLQSAFGMDVARYRDLSVIAPMQIMRTLRRVVPFLVELHRVPFAQQKQIAIAILRALPRRIGARIDGTGIGAGIAEDLQTAEGAEPILISTQWYREEMPPLKAAFEDDMILVPRDADVLADLRAIKMIGGLATLPALRQTGASGGARHGDAGIAITLAHSASRHPSEAYDYQSARKGAREGEADTGGRWSQESDRMFGSRRDALG